MGFMGLRGPIAGPLMFKADASRDSDMVVRGADVYRRRAAPEGRAPPAPKPAPKPKGPDPKPGQAYGEPAPGYGPFNAGAHGAPPKAQPKKEAPKPKAKLNEARGGKVPAASANIPDPAAAGPSNHGHHHHTGHRHMHDDNFQTGL